MSYAARVLRDEQKNVNGQLRSELAWRKRAGPSKISDRNLKLFRKRLADLRLAVVILTAPYIAYANVDSEPVVIEAPRFKRNRKK